MFTVTTAADAGFGSLRDAITRSTALPDPDMVVFAPDLAGATVLLATVGDPGSGPSALLVSPGTIRGPQ